MMKYLKILGLAAIAAAALMAFAGSASATTLTSPSGTVYESTIHATSEGKVVLATGFGEIKCESTVEGTAGKSGGEFVEGAISVLSWSNCGTGCEAKTLTGKTGSLKIKHTAGSNGELTGVGQEVTTNCFGFDCIWSTGTGTKLGTVTGGTTATLDIENAKIRRTGGSSGAFCGTEGTWTGSYSVDTPDTLIVD